MDPIKPAANRYPQPRAGMQTAYQQWDTAFWSQRSLNQDFWHISKCWLLKWRVTESTVDFIGCFMQCYDKTGPGYCRVNVPLFPFANNFYALPPWPQGLGYFPPPTKITTLRMTAFLLFFSLDASAILFYKRHSESRSQCQADDHTLCGCFWNSEYRKINGPGQMSLFTRQFKSVSKGAHMHTQTQTQTRIRAAWTYLLSHICLPMNLLLVQIWQYHACL